MHGSSPTPISPISLNGYAVAVALAAALLALLMGLLAATLTGPQREVARALDGWNLLLAGNLRTVLAFSMPLAGWLAAVAAYLQFAPAGVLARAALMDTHRPTEATALPAEPLREQSELPKPAQIRRPFHDALREDWVDLTSSRRSLPTGLQAGSTNTGKEVDEMLKHQMAVMALATAGSLAACDFAKKSPQSTARTTAMERPSDQRTPPKLEGWTATAPSTEGLHGQTVNAFEEAGRILFQCATEDGKEILLRDRRRVIDYSFGRPGQTPELSLSVPRAEATTYQWQGMGRWITYSVTVPIGTTKYTVFTSADRIDDAHQLDAGVVVHVGNDEIARVRCIEPIRHELEGVDLKQID